MRKSDSSFLQRNTSRRTRAITKPFVQKTKRRRSHGSFLKSGRPRINRFPLTKKQKTTIRRNLFMNDVASTLVAHCGARKVTRGELKELPIPEGTRTHQPLSHY